MYRHFRKYVQDAHDIVSSREWSDG
jgi:hypothetical protein